MAVDLNDYIDDLKNEVNSPGTDNFPDASDDDWLTSLRNGFWDARLDGILAGYTEKDGLLSNATSGGPDPTRDLIQVVIFYAGFRTLRSALRSVQTSVLAKAGPVEYQTQTSATVLRELLKELQSQRAILLKRLSDLGLVPTFVYDGGEQRSLGLELGVGVWTAGREYTEFSW